MADAKYNAERRISNFVVAYADDLGQISKSQQAELLNLVWANRGKEARNRLTRYVEATATKRSAAALKGATRKRAKKFAALPHQRRRQLRKLMKTNELRSEEHLFWAMYDTQMGR